MSNRSSTEQKLLDSKLEKALDEALSKVNIALDKASKPSASFAMEIWLAAEALEYSSFLFNLAHGLEDVKPAVKPRKHEAAIVLIKDSMNLLKLAREGRQESATNAYTNLRTAADYLKTAHLDQVKKFAKKRDSV